MTSTTPSGLLMPHAARMARHTEKTLMVLQFLREEMWSSTHVLSVLLGVAYSTTHQLMKRMSDAQLIKSVPMFIAGTRGATRVVLHGITHHGLAMSFPLDSTTEIGRVWEPSKISPLFVPHQLELQEARLRAQGAGWQSWRPARLLSGMGLPKLPDAETIDPDGVSVAIELERHIKSLRRYEVVIGSYILVIKQQRRWQRIDYLCPNLELAHRLSHAFSRVEQVRVEATATHPGRCGPIEQTHLDLFRFYAVEDWPSGPYKQARLPS